MAGLIDTATQQQHPDWWQPQEMVNQALTTQADVDAFGSMVKSGNYQGAYNLGKARGFDNSTLEAYADSVDGGAWRAGVSQPGKALDGNLANTFANTAANYDTLNSAIPSAFQNQGTGMDSNAFRNLAGSATSAEDYWTGLSGLVGAGARANDANTNAIAGDNLTLTQDALNRVARAQYAGDRMSAADVAASQHGKAGYGNDWWVNNNRNMQSLTGLSQEAMDSTGFRNIPAEWIRRNTSAEQIANAKDPAAYLRQLALTYHASPQAAASQALSPENQAQWNTMLGNSKVLRDPNTGGYLMYDAKSGNFNLLNEYGTGLGVYDPNKVGEFSKSGIDPSLFARLRAGEGEIHKFQQVPQEMLDTYKEGGQDALWGWNGGAGGTGGTGTSGTPVTGGTGTTGTPGTGGVTQGSYSYSTNGNPTTTQVDPATETVEQRIANLVNPENPINQRIATAIKERANARGLLNSSMAEQATQAAIIDNAQGIANADAQTYTQTRFRNQDALNEFSRAAQAHGFNMETLGQNFANDFAKMDKQFSIWKDQLGATRANDLQDKYMNGVGAAQNQFAQMFSNIQNSNMDEGQKTAALQQAQILRDNTLSMFNSMFSNMPTWSDSYKLLAPSYQ